MDFCPYGWIVVVVACVVVYVNRCMSVCVCFQLISTPSIGTTCLLARCGSQINWAARKREREREMQTIYTHTHTRTHTHTHTHTHCVFIIIINNIFKISPFHTLIFIDIYIFSCLSLNNDNFQLTWLLNKYMKNLIFSRRSFLYNRKDFVLARIADFSFIKRYLFI